MLSIQRAVIILPLVMGVPVEICNQQLKGPLQFDVASIHLNTDCSGGPQEEHFPGRFVLRCVSLREMIRVAYGTIDGTAPAKPPEVVGGPRWIDTDRYDIEATAPGNPGLDQMYGPMTRALLEDRFLLKLHDEIRTVPVYNLTILKTAKPKLAEDRSCVQIDLSTVLQSPPPPNYCGRNTETNGPPIIFDGHGVTMTEFIARGLRSLDRPVIDETHLAGRYDIHLEFESPDALDIGRGSTPSVFSAIQEELGLKLTASTGSVTVHVIDSVNRPSGN